MTAATTLAQGIVEIATNCHRLEQLKVDRCVNLTNTAIIAIANNCPSLYIASLSHCVNVSDAAIIEITEKCPELHDLHVINCRVTDAVVRDIKKRFPNLTLGSLQKIRKVKQVA